VAETNPLPRFADSLPIFVGDLRAWVFTSQVKAGRYFGLTHATISRYENGHITPQLGYLACLARLATERLALNDQAVENYQKTLLQEVNKALRWCYAGEKPFRDWSELCSVAEDFIAERQVTEHPPEPACDRRTDWGEAPDVPAFYGRSQELKSLARWILVDRCRLVGVLGMGGVGKTTLVVKLTEQVQDEFDYVVWRSLRNAPPIDDILNDYLGLLPNRLEYNVLDSVDRKTSLLVECLCNHRCLLVLDGAEAILREGDEAGRCREGYEAYRELIQRVGGMRHQSCLLLTSREKPRGIVQMEGKSFPVRTFRLGGLGSIEGQKIFHDKDLAGPEEAWTVLVDRYSGNPLALKFVAEIIQEVFAGDVTRFLDSGTSVFGGVRWLFDQQFDRLSEPELEIMYWLAVKREAVSVRELRESTVFSWSTGAIVEALRSLRRRSLVEKSANGMTLHDVVLNYTTDRLIDHICEQMVSENVLELQRYALIEAQAKEYVRRSQVCLILNPIAKRLVASLGQSGLEKKLQHLLTALQAEKRTPGYAGGNILNLLIHLAYDIRGYDFSELEIRQAYLQDAELHEVNFAQANLAHSVFADAFVGASAIALSPGGELLAAGTGEDIRLWQVASEQPQAIFKGHTGLVWAVAFSPDGRILASGSADRTVRLWDVNTGQVLGILHGHTSRVWSVAFSPGGEILASSSEDQTIRLWNIRTGRTLLTLKGHTDTVFSMAFSPDGHLLASGGAGQTIRLWDVGTGQMLCILGEHTDTISSVAFNPDGDILASGGYDCAIRLWDLHARRLLGTLEGHTDAVSSIAFSPDGAILASGSYDYSIRSWNVERDVEPPCHVLHGHTQEVKAVAFSQDGKTLASCGYDRTIRLWDVETGQVLRILRGCSQEIRSIAFSPDGETVASSGADQVIHLWDAHTGQVRYDLPGHSRWVASVAFSPDGRILASGSYDRTVRLWDAFTGQTLHVLYRHVHWVWFVVFSPDGQTLASGGAGTKIHLRDVHTGQTIQTLKGHTRGIRCAVFHPDGGTLASGSEDQTVRLWDVHTGRSLLVLPEHSGKISSVAFSPDGAILVSGSEDQTVRLWDSSTGQSLRTLKGHIDAVSAVACSTDGETLASGGADQTVRLWDIHTGQALRVLHEHTSPVSSIAFSPDGAILASASLDGAIKLWQVKTGTGLRTLQRERLYEGMNIAGVAGLTEAQKATLKTLGAVEIEI
jgi:WD40 repeat protein